MSQSEAALIDQAKAGSMAAFESLVNLHGQMVYNLALRTLNNAQEAEDIAQETFIRAWKALPDFRAEARFSTWLYRITTNLCYNRLPHLKGELVSVAAADAEALPDEQRTVERNLITEEFYDLVWTAVDNLPESYRLLITLRHVQGMSYQEIAEIVDMPLGSVKTGIFRARKLLRDRLTFSEESLNE